jgi:hypothetical protein
MKRERVMPSVRSALLLALLLGGEALAAERAAVIPAVVADFDYYDTSGEALDQSAQHAARVKIFADLLRDELAAHGRYRILPLTCPEPACSAGRMDANELMHAARRSGARLLVYGGIHKESTLVQWAKVEVVDLNDNKLLLDRLFSFRGDTDEAFRRAAAFIGQSLEDVAPRS